MAKLWPRKRRAHPSFAPVAVVAVRANQGAGAEAEAEAEAEAKVEAGAVPNAGIGARTARVIEGGAWLH